MDWTMTIRRAISQAVLVVVDDIPQLPQPEPRINRTLARLRLCRMKMRKQGIYSCSGYTPPPRGESVQQLWARHGWTPPREGLRLEPAMPAPEIRNGREVLTLRKVAR